MTRTLRKNACSARSAGLNTRADRTRDHLRNQFARVLLHGTFGLLTALIGLLTLLSGPALAQQDMQVGGWFERLDRTIIVQTDGSFIEMIDEAFVIEQHGSDLPDLVQRILHWNGSSGSLEVLEAVTVKADGRRLEAPAEMQFEGTQDGENGLYQGQRFRVISFIDFEAGDKIVLRARHRRTLPFFPGQFFEMRTAPIQPVNRMRIIYDLPASMKLHHDARGFELESVRTLAGRKREQWRYAGQNPPRTELRGVAASDYADRLIVSTMADHGALARAYLHDAAPMAWPDPNIRALAQSIVADKYGPWAQARTLYDWVRNNIAYGGDYLGRASVVPSPASETLTSGQGDCKDHATLFESLLRAVGIESSQVLVNASNAYRVGTVPTLGIFNHVLTWIPSLGLFVDSSAISVEFGQLPTVLSDKPALIVKEERLARTPVQSPRTQSIGLEVQLREDGNAQIAMNELTTGWLATERRRMFSQTDPPGLADIADAMLLGSGLTGDGWIEERRQTNEESSGLYLGAQAAGLLDIDVPRSLRLISSVGTGIASALADFASFRTHQTPSVCVAARIHETATWHFPAGMSISYLPAAVQIAESGFEYRAEYGYTEGKLWISRRLLMDFPSNVCSPERFKQLKQLAAQVFDDLAISVQTVSIPR
jgi:transglutaminase-like putative cysteine protease